jgi:hypothetical protein
MVDVVTGATNFVLNAAHAFDTSPYVSGLMVLTLNTLGKVVVPGFTPSAEKHLANVVSKFAIVFIFSWVGSRQIFTATMLALAFVLVSEYLLNEDSRFCIVPARHRLNLQAELEAAADTDGNGRVSDAEYQKAIQTLERAKRDQLRDRQRKQFQLFGDYLVQAN